jgi:predicted DNA-binding transcriptional regulator AlpA
MTGQSEAPKRFLTQKKLAEHFSTTQRSIRRWQKAGLLPPPVRIGIRAIRYDVEAVERALRDRHVGSPVARQATPAAA